jgi:type III secretory pathway lipoprotein EscJ
MFLKNFKFFLKLFICLGLLSANLWGGEAKERIVQGVSSKEANIVIHFLDQKVIQGEKVSSNNQGEGLWDVCVPSRDKAAAVRHLNFSERSPRDLVEEFSIREVIPSDEAINKKYQQALELMLASIIRKKMLVSDAKVEVSFPSAGTPAKAVVAKVWIQPTPNCEITTSQCDELKRLLCPLVSNLKNENILILPF